MQRLEQGIASTLGSLNWGVGWCGGVVGWGRDRVGVVD